MQSVQILTKSCWLLTADLELLLEMLADDVTAEDVGEEDGGLFLGTSTLKCNVRWRLLEEGGEEGQDLVSRTALRSGFEGREM